MAVIVFSPTVDGVLAAILSPLFMSIGFFIWDKRWTSSGASAFALNMYKCNLATIGFVVMCLARGFSFPGQNAFTRDAVGFLILSSTLGIIVGDVLWLEALRLLGAKHVIVVDSLKPFAAAALGRLALDEVLRPPAWGGMALTVAGVGAVAWEEQRAPSVDRGDEGGANISRTDATDRVDFHNEGLEVADDRNFPAVGVGEKATEDAETDLGRRSRQKLSTESHITNPEDRRRRYKRGYMCAIVNVIADSLGSFLTKKYGVGMTTWSINLIRFGFAGVALACVSIGMRLCRRCLQSRELTDGNETAQDRDTAMATEDENQRSASNDGEYQISAPMTKMPLPWFELPTMTRWGWLQILCGVLFVTFLCPALGNYALFQIALGLAVSLGSIGPLYGLLLDWPFRGRRPTIYGSAGAVLAVAGVVILCMWGT